MLKRLLKAEVHFEPWIYVVAIVASALLGERGRMDGELSDSWAEAAGSVARRVAVPALAIRTFEPRDLPRIVRIERASFGEFAWPADAFEESGVRVAAAVSGGVCAGAWIAGYSVTVRSRHGAELVSIAVHPRYRRHRVASAVDASQYSEGAAFGRDGDVADGAPR